MLLHMGKEINKKIIAETTRCEKEFGCLNNDLNCCYKVEYRVYQKALYLICLDNRFCSYKRSFGFLFICGCPTRKEILHKFGI